MTGPDDMAGDSVVVVTMACKFLYFHLYAELNRQKDLKR